MPWEIREGDGKFCVHKKGEEEPMKCYKTKAEATDYLQALYANAGGKSDELIYFGDEVKALADGKVGGYLIRYAVDTHDLTGDYFSKDSEIEIPLDNLPIYYNHGQDSKMKKRVIGRATIKKDDVGLWLEGQLALRDEYEKAVDSMVKMGKLGLSSGALSHLVEREAKGEGIFFIKSWVVGEASLTPTPAEPLNHVVSLKSLTTPDLAALPKVEDEQILSEPIKENKKMAEEMDVKALVAAALKERDDAEQAKKDRAAEIEAAKAEGAKAAVEELKSKGALKTAYHTTEKRSDSDDGVQAFKSWLCTGQVNSELISPKQSWKSNADPYEITNNSDGSSYLIPDPLYNTIIPKRDLASFIRQTPAQVFSTSADHLLIPVEGTSNVAFVQTAESGAFDQDEATFVQKDAILWKFTKEIRASTEFLDYNGTNFESWLTDSIARAVAVTENTIYTTGVGTTAPEGIKTFISGTNEVAVDTTLVLAAADLTELVGTIGDGYNVQGQCGFLMKNATKWYLHGIAGSGAYPFISIPAIGPTTGAAPAAGASGFLGYPAFVSDDMDAYTTTTGHSVIFGNWNFYAVVERPGILVQRNPWLYMANGLVGIFASIFRGGLGLQTEAFAYLHGKS